MYVYISSVYLSTYSYDTYRYIGTYRTLPYPRSIAIVVVAVAVGGGGYDTVGMIDGRT